MMVFTMRNGNNLLLFILLLFYDLGKRTNAFYFGNSALFNRFSSIAASKADECSQLEKIFHSISTSKGMKVVDIQWYKEKVEISLECLSLHNETGSVSPDLDQLTEYNRDVSLQIETEYPSYLEQYEIVCTSPGHAFRITEDSQVESLKGFQVKVSMVENSTHSAGIGQMQPKKSPLVGTLVCKQDNCLHISIKGKIIKIPWNEIESIVLK